MYIHVYGMYIHVYGMYIHVYGVYMAYIYINILLCTFIWHYGIYACICHNYMDPYIGCIWHNVFICMMHDVYYMPNVHVYAI